MDDLVATGSQRQQLLGAILTAKLQEGRELLGHYIRAFTIFVAMTGALLTLALNERATPELRLSLMMFGAALTGLGFAVCGFGEILRRATLREIDELSSELNVPACHGGLLAVRFTVIIVVVFLVFEAVGWAYLLISQMTAG